MQQPNWGHLWENIGDKGQNLGEKGQIGQKGVWETTLQMPLADRDVESMLKTAELSFLSLWERAKCSRYFSAVYGEGCVGADSPYLPCRPQRSPHCSRWVSPWKELQPTESLCWSRFSWRELQFIGDPHWSQFILNDCSPQEGHAGDGEKCEEQGKAERGCYKLSTCEQGVE